ncbi:hypothetical protein IC619_000170 [Hazenella sp. IB182353]|uniref:hypothetical protein n=1 Tax=Polycladospora coralii TaxID=2771432 RepID=UPI0017470733|nr:hypothetical protein [Polycladospora coralii]MBS7528910.1 hypothetical protein [Polycladospora coralii]
MMISLALYWTSPQQEKLKAHLLGYDFITGESVSRISAAADFLIPGGGKVLKLTDKAWGKFKGLFNQSSTRYTGARIKKMDWEIEEEKAIEMYGEIRQSSCDCQQYRLEKI